MGSQLLLAVQKAKDNEDEAVIEVIETFKPLIKKYSKKLAYDEAETDLIIAIIEVLKSIPVHKNKEIFDEKNIIAYIHKSIKHRYIKLSKQHSIIFEKVVSFDVEMFTDNENYDIETNIALFDLLDKLPVIQKRVIIDKFFKGYSEAEIAANLSVTRQAVNKAKNKALHKLAKDLLYIQ